MPAQSAGRRERPEDCPAVVGGNVETSQRVVDVLLGALGLAAASQGTMNNLLFGDATFGYYETICGGSGATPHADGADAVHTHMTNTRLTDPEVLERRYPVRLLEFSIRRGSGGAGRHRGGDGIVRRIEFLRPTWTSRCCSQRRGPYPPYGLAGGSPGALGQNTLHRADGTVEPLGGQVQFTARAGDVLVDRNARRRRLWVFIGSVQTSMPQQPARAKGGAPQTASRPSLAHRASVLGSKRGKQLLSPPPLLTKEGGIFWKLGGPCPRDAGVTRTLLMLERGRS